ncbi:MAG: hypothetical protein EGR97_03925 [Clostridiales bacterium]|uniref:Uncharacterized protein n=1 Tax=Congzhengia minquanensis TaxID=2763657 RepID=A0A926DI66_9FIRM|nr:hypothetical protein [Congzhengia minquanensis]MBC8539365.1 hypothetical protein [Congzhengia minquanensis]MBD8946448.1 hypothetical protein [Clostridiales bacterium]
MISLKTDSINLLYDCYIKQRSNLLWVLECKDLINIDHNLGNQLRDAVGDELLIYGFNGDEPNQYGILLESLIDEIGRLFIYN